MDLYTISKDKRTLSINKKSITFDDDIENVLEFSEILCVCLINNDYHADGSVSINMEKQPINNVYGIDKKCSISWRIEQVTSPYLGTDPNEFYSGILKISDKVLRIFTFRCITFDIDIYSLEVINRYFAR